MRRNRDLDPADCRLWNGQIAAAAAWRSTNPPRGRRLILIDRNFSAKISGQATREARNGLLKSLARSNSLTHSGSASHSAALRSKARSAAVAWLAGALRLAARLHQDAARTRSG